MHRYPEHEDKGGGELGTETNINLNQQLWYHAVGTQQSEDVLLLAIPEHPDWLLGPEITDDGRLADYLCF